MKKTKLSPTKTKILYDLYKNVFSYAKKHVTPTGKSVFRLMERTHSPIRNVGENIFNDLIKEGYIKKCNDNLFIITAKGNQLFNKY